LAALKRLALVRLDALGDTLLTTPAVAMLRQHAPDCELLALTHPAGTSILRPLCEVKEVTPAASWRELARHLHDFQPDAVICCSEKRRAALATWASAAPLRVGFNPGWRQPLKALASGLFFHRMTPANPDLHETERYARLVELTLNLHSLEVPPLQLLPSPAHYQAAQAWTAPLGIQLTPKWCRYGYTVQHLRQWLARLPGPWLGLTGPAEEEWARRHFPQQNLYCSGDLFEYAAVLEGLRVLVTIDTGAAHVAAARGVATVDVFPENNHQHCVPRWRPWRCRHEIVLQPKFTPAAVEEIGLQIRGAVDRLWNAPE
jgi:ADP-heptose:LPS heptosyltransferase